MTAESISPAPARGPRCVVFLGLALHSGGLASIGTQHPYTAVSSFVGNSATP
jgi:hypothetical protein